MHRGSGYTQSPARRLQTGKIRRQAVARGNPLLTFPKKNAIEFSAQQSAEGGQIKPDQGGDSSAEGAVEHRVVGDARDVPAEGQRGRKPEQRGGHGPRSDQEPMLFAPGAEVIERAENGDAGEQGDRPAR